MADYYCIHGTAAVETSTGSGLYESYAGDNANNGTSEQTPKKTLANVISTHSPTAADTIYIAGVQVGEQTTQAKIKQWPGQIQAYMTVAVAPTDDSGLTWSLTGSTYRCTVAGLTLGAAQGNVCAAWGTRVNADGQRYPWYPTGTLTGDNLDTDQTVAYSGTTLYIRDTSLFTGGVTPNTLTGVNAVRYVNGVAAVILTNTGAYTEVDGVIFFGACTRAAPSYCIQCGSASGVLLNDCEFWEAETHNITISHTSNVNAAVSNCLIAGGGTTTGATLTATHCSTNGGDVTNTIFDECVFRCYPLRKVTDAYFDTAIRIDGGYSHTTGVGGGTVDSVLYNQCDFYHYGRESTSVSTADSAAIGNADNPATYPVRLYRCRIFDSCGQEVTGNVSYDRSFCGVNGGSTIDLTFNSLFYMVSSATTNLCFRSCVILANTDQSGTNECAVFRFNDGVKLTTICCTIVNLAASAGDFHRMGQITAGANEAYVAGSAGWRWKSERCMFIYNSSLATSWMMVGDDASPATNLQFSGNWYRNIVEGYSQHTERNTEAEWDDADSEGVDSTGVYGTDPEFVNAASTDPAVVGVPGAASTVWTTIKTITVNCDVGYNGRRDGGQVGAYQNGAAQSIAPFTAAAKILLKLVG